MSYQSFPWLSGDSRSFEKLLRLYLPSLRGRSLLDVGCNAGFFCGWAQFQEASRVVGIDRDPAFIEQARLWFEGPTFKCMGWDKLGPEQYDLVLCLSALHYADGQAALLELLMSRVKPGGLLVLELGVAQGSGEEFVEGKRSIDTRKFPTRAMLEHMLQKYAYKRIGPSVEQGGDPVPRWVYHVQHRLPLAVTLLDTHYSGKTSVAKAILRPGLPRVSGDVLFRKICLGEIAASPELEPFIRFVPGTEHLDSAAVTMNICAAGLVPQLAALFAERGGGQDFVLDSVIPAEFRREFLHQLEEAGYFPVNIELALTGDDKLWTRKRPPFAEYEAYNEYLQQLASIDEDAYLAANPDVARAVAAGKLPSGQAHYCLFGKREKRRLKP